MIESEAYNTYYAYATGEKTSKPKYVQKKADSKTSPKKKLVQAPKGKRLKATAKIFWKSSDDDADNQDGDDQDDENADDQDDDGQDDDKEQIELDNDGDDFVNPKLSTFDKEERRNEKLDEENEGSDLRVQTPSHFESTDDEAYDEVNQGVNAEEEKLDEEKTNEEEEVNELYDDVNISLEGRDTGMTNALLTNVQATQMNEAIKTAVQLQSDRLRDEAQAKNKDFINKLDENIKKIIKEQVKVQVKEQVSKILPRIEKLVNEQLVAKVLTRSSNEAKTSHAVASNLSELELKRIVIDKIKSNKSIHRSVQQKTLYKALINVYETDKVILDTYGDTVTFKRLRDDEDDDEEPFAGSKRGSKRRRARKEPESSSAPKEKSFESTGKSKEGSKSHQKFTGMSAQANEPIHTAEDLEEPKPKEFNTCFTKDQPVKEASWLPDWF
nr:hypothetical protein [Tanacetum cinerariifolium]